MIVYLKCIGVKLGTTINNMYVNVNNIHCSVWKIKDIYLTGGQNLMYIFSFIYILWNTKCVIVVLILQ